MSARAAAIVVGALIAITSPAVAATVIYDINGTFSSNALAAGDSFSPSLNQATGSGIGAFTSFEDPSSQTEAAPSRGITLILMSSPAVNGVSNQVQSLGGGDSAANVTDPSGSQRLISSAVPEPVTITLFGGGLALIGVARWRRRAAK
jgi:hypothetical protein